jgi:hypothetical protein
MARMHRKLVAIFDTAAHFIDIREIQPRVYALRIQIECQGDEIDIAGALAVAEQAAFDAVRAGRLKIILDSGVGCQTSVTALQTSSANSGSVVLNTSGEYS